MIRLGPSYILFLGGLGDCFGVPQMPFHKLVETSQVQSRKSTRLVNAAEVPVAC